MLDDFESYAVYWVPGRSDMLAHFGSSWMGWCAEKGELRDRKVIDGFSDDIAIATRQVGRHGFHGVIRAPFKLRADRSRWSIDRAIQLASDAVSEVALPALELAVIGGRVSLVPVRALASISTIVSVLEDCIKPLARVGERGVPKSGHHSSLRQLPVGPAHRFHMPLTDRIDLGMAFRIREELEPRIKPLLDAKRSIAEIALMGDPGGGRPLRVLQSFELRKAPHRPSCGAMPCQGPQTLVPIPEPEWTATDLAV